MTRTVECRITGRVQGVGFRAWTRDQAERLGVSGWVRNEPDGAVRACLSGEAGAVAQMLGALDRGPPAARVDDVEATPAEVPGAPGFRVIA